ncbi:MAG: Ig-like domain-containing protein [Dehalococcoidia bacterium]
MRKLPLLGGLVLLVATLLPAAWPSSVAAVDPENIVENGGFEAGELDGWTVVDWDGVDANGTWCPQSGTLAPGITGTKSGIVCGFDGPIEKGPLPKGKEGGGGSGSTVEPPPEGETAAMSDQDGPSSSVLYQCVDIPAGASAELSFQLYLLNVEGKGDGEYHTPPTLDPFLGGGKPQGQAFPLGNGKPGANQQFRADIVSTAGMDGDPFTLASGDVLMNVYQTDPGDPNESGYDPVTADLSALAGQSVCIRFALVDNQFFFNAGVDDVKLLVGEGEEPTPTETPPGGGVDVTVEDEEVGVGDDVDVTATVTDDEGNPIEGQDCTFEIVDQPGDDATVEAGPVATDANGEATTTLHAGTTPGTVQVEATCGAFTEVLDVVVSPAELPATGAAGEPDGTPAWAVALAVGLAAIGLGALTMRRRIASRIR